MQMAQNTSSVVADEISAALFFAVKAIDISVLWAH
jgi:hypothetical protein